MLFMPDISMVKYEMAIGLPTAVPSSNVEMSGNDKAVAQPTCYLAMRYPAIYAKAL
jgi:hypothetical protein